MMDSGSIYVPKIGSGVIAASDGPALVTVPNVPMISTGIEYPLSSGPTTFTPEDLADIVASQEDPAIHAPRTKIGHTDPRFNALVSPDGIFMDGEPSLGSWQNLRLSEDEQTVYGDIVGVPKWLAAIMSTAFPSRSVEGNFDVETVTGHKWRLAIEFVSLLGVIGPGVTTLDDLPQLYSEDGPEGVQVIEAREGDAMSVKADRVLAGSGVAGSVNIEDVRRQYYDSLDAGQLFWWVRAIYVDPNELIVDDDEGGLYRVPFEVKGDGVDFGEASQVVIKYVDKPKSKTSAALRASLTDALGQVGHRLVAASFDSRSESRPGSNNEEAMGMTPEQIRLLRERLGLSETELPDDASQEQITAALSAEASPEGDGEDESGSGAPPAESSDDDEGDGEQEGQPAEGEPEPAGATASKFEVPDGFKLVDEAAWSEVQAGAKAGANLAAREAIKDRDGTIAAAVKAGKFPPVRAAHYKKAWDRDPEGTRALIDILPDDSVPVTVRASQGDGDMSNDAYDESLLSPGERKRIAAARSGEDHTITVGGD